VLSDVADVIYLCSDYYDAERESGFRFDDPEVGIRWPELDFVVSDRDRNAPLLRSAPQQAAH
jgi:dTDP-4-dehydrorhamnose 3,5-epimerase